MTDWTYVVEEGGFNQDFLLIDRATGEPLDLTDSTLTMFIQSSDFQTDFPTGGSNMSVVQNADGVDVARLVVQSTFMPQVAGMFYAQIKVQMTSIVSTFILNLRVIRSLSS